MIILNDPRALRLLLFFEQSANKLGSKFLAVAVPQEVL